MTLFSHCLIPSFIICRWQLGATELRFSVPMHCGHSHFCVRGDLCFLSRRIPCRTRDTCSFWQQDGCGHGLSYYWAQGGPCHRSDTSAAAVGAHRSFAHASRWLYFLGLVLRAFPRLRLAHWLPRCLHFVRSGSNYSPLILYFQFRWLGSL